MKSPCFSAFFGSETLVPPLEQEIRELRSAFWSDRDPDGRAFAPLADAYRREGDLEQALELLHEGLERHPDFASGHVVAGWVHRDRGDAAAAASAFRAALDLDAENAEALRGLGELAAAGGREEEALRWLGILSDLEPGDASLRRRIEEIVWARDTLASEGGPIAEHPEAPAPDVAEPALPGDDALTEGIAALPLDQPEEPEGTADLDLAALEAALVAEDEAAWAPPVEPEVGDGMAGAAPVEAEDEDETDGASTAEAEPVGEAVVVTTEDVLETGDVVQDAGETGEVSELDVRVGGPEEGEPEAPADELPESEEEEEAGHGLYTRTMAELYARQGLEARALDVYEQLLAVAPGDEELRARVEALRERVERSHAPPAEAAPAPAVAPPAPDPDAERRAEEEMEILAQDWARPAEQPEELSSPFAWASEEADREDEEAGAQGPPVRDYFRRMLSWERGQGASGPAEAAEATGEVMAPEPEAAEGTVDVAEPAPEPAERTVDIAELAPEAEAAEPTVDIAELAPDAEPEAAEPTVDIAELVPDAEAEAAERTVDIAELAPDAGSEGGDGPRDEGEGRDGGGDAFSRWLNQLR